MNTSNQKLRVCELFAGIGGFRLGIEQALGKENVEFVYVSEWDKYAAEIYNRRFSDSSHLGEEKTERELSSERTGIESEGSESSVNGGKSAPVLCDTRDIRTVPTSEIPDHDLLVGGFPCQAFSIAGKRRGFDDTRGTLFFEIARILKDRKPKFFILENVKGLLSHDSGNTFKTIISTLTELGYDLQWQVLNSKNFGVPQNRERVFIVGHIRGQPRPKVFPIRESDVGDNEKQLSGKETYGERDIKDNKGGGGYPLPTNTKLGYDLAEERNDGIRLEHPKSKTARGRVIKGASQSLKTSAQVGVIDTVPYVRNPYNGKQSETETGTIGTSVGTSTGKTAQLLHKDLRIRRLTPTECERLQSFPDGWTEYGIDEKGEEVEISDTQRYKCLGNAVTVNVVYEVARRLNE